MDPTVEVTCFAHAESSHGSVFRCLWSEFASTFGPHQHSPGPKIQTPAFSPTVFKNGSRSKASADRLTLGVIDFDSVPNNTMIRVIEHLNDSRLSYLFYTTWSHNHESGTVRARIVAPFNRPIPATQWALLWPSFLDQTVPSDLLPQLLAKDKGHSQIDHMISNVAAIYFGPYVAPETDLSTCTWFHVQGEPINVDALQARKPDVIITTTPLTRIPRDVLARLATTLSRSTDPGKIEAGIRLKQVVNGESFAQQTERDNVIYHLSLVLAERLPHADPRSVAEHFAASLQLMDREAPDCPTVNDVEYKIERAQLKAREDRAKKSQQIVIDTTVRMRNGWRLLGVHDRETPYTDQELESFADREGCTVADFSSRWIIRRHNGVYVYGNGQYTGPYVVQQDAPLAIDQILAPASSLNLYRLVNGMAVPLSVDTLTRKYGTIARRVTIDMTAQRQYYNADSAEMIEAPFPMRDLIPEFDPQIDQWLAFLAKEKTPLLKNWLADTPNLQYPCAALFLFGAAGSGKSLLAAGLSRIFNDQGPADMSEVIGQSFNDEILKNPIVLADESLPTDYRGKVRTEEIRRAIQAHETPLKRKYLPTATLKGCPRFLLLANSEAMLTQSGELTAQDIAAISERFILIEVSEEAAHYLRSIKHRHWVKESTIAKHVLWLYHNHHWLPQGRFRHRDDSDYLKTVLTIRSGLRYAVCMFLVRYLQQPSKLDVILKGDGILIRHDRLYVQPKIVANYWQTYLPLERIPEASRIAKAIRGISRRKSTIQVSDRLLTFQQISTKALIAWSKDNDEMTPYEIQQALSKRTNA